MANPLELIVAKLLETDSPVRAIVQLRVYPVKPTKNATLPYLIVTGQPGGGGATGMNLNQRRGTQNNDYGLEAHARSQEQAAALLAAATGFLDGWRDRAKGVQGCFALDDADETIDDDVHISTQSVSLWYNA